MNIQFVANKSSQAKEISSDKRARKSESVFQDLKRRILTGELTPDSPITEQSFAKDYACSQSTIREALMLLQECGLVVRRGYQGTFVTDPSLPEAMLLLRLRVDIETSGIAEAAKVITPDQVEELRDLDRQFLEGRRRRDVFACSEVDTEFHLQIFKLGGMPALEQMLVRTTIMLQRVMLPNPRPDEIWIKPNVVRHADILDALEARDVEAATNAVKAHILSSAVVLAPHFYGDVVEELLELFEKEPTQIACLARR